MTQDVQPLTWSRRTNLEEHQQFFSKINEIIANLAPTVDEAEQAIAQATQAITNANAAIATANAASAAASAAASQAQTAASIVTGYDTRLTAAEGDIDALQAADQTMAGNISALGTRMTAAESKNSQQDTAIGALQTADAQNVKISRINEYAVGLTGNQPDILGRKGFKGIVDFTSNSSYSSDDFVSANVKTIYSSTDADSTILEERQIAKEAANTIRFDTRNRMSKDGTNANRIDTYFRTVINETTETVTLQLFILVYENNVQVRSKNLTIATLTAE